MRIGYEKQAQNRENKNAYKCLLCIAHIVHMYELPVERALNMYLRISTVVHLVQYNTQKCSVGRVKTQVAHQLPLH